MALIDNTQIYMPSGAAEIRDDILTDIRLAAIERGITNPPIHPKSDWYVLATAYANVSLIQYTNIRLSEENGDILRATKTALDSIRDAEGLPVVSAAPSLGKVIVSVAGRSAITIPDATEFLLPNGLRGRVAGQHVGVVTDDEIPVVAIDTGTDTNLAAGRKVRFVAPPLNLEVEAEVSASSPLRGGVDAETDERKRARILNRRRMVPQGGNPGHLIEVALNALATVQYAFVYPGLGGPASVKICVVRDIDVDKKDWGRTMLDGGLRIVRTALHSELPDGIEVIVGTTTDVPTNVALEVTIPDSVSAGGNGLGWIDAAPWPPLVGGDSGRVTITTVTSSTNITVSAGTTTSPVAGQTHVAWWSAHDQSFETRLVTAVSGGTGAWVLTLDQPLVDSDNGLPSTGDFVSPAAVNSSGYGATWRGVMRVLGPGENTSDLNRLPRSLRQPFISEEWHSDLGFRQLDTLVAAHREIVDVDYTYREYTTPPVPGSVATSPGILVPNNFGVYSK